MTFLFWLLTQTEREDQIGDLARDAERIVRNPKLWRGSIPESWRTDDPTPDMETFGCFEDERGLELALDEFASALEEEAADEGKIK